MKTGLLFTWAAAAAMLAGCSQESVVDSSVNKMENAIGFSTYKNVSRGNPVNDNAEFMKSGNKFGVTAFINNTTTSPYMGAVDKGISILSNGSLWNYENDADLAYWPTQGETLDFYGYAPYGTAGLANGMTALAFSKTDGMSFTYTVPTATADQQDVMFALAAAKGKPAAGERVKMAFKHALTQVHFRIGTKTTNLKVDVAANGIKISNLKNTGDFKLTALGAESWILPATAGTTAYTITSDAVTGAGYIGTTPKFTPVIATDTLMLLPQEFKAKTATETTGAFLTISCKIYQEGATATEKTYLVGSDTAFGTVEVPISSKRDATEVWKRNKKVTYNILIGEGGTLEPILFASEVETWVPEDGGTVAN